MTNNNNVDWNDIRHGLDKQSLVVSHCPRCHEEHPDTMPCDTCQELKAQTTASSENEEVKVDKVYADDDNDKKLSATLLEATEQKVPATNEVKEQDVDIKKGSAVGSTANKEDDIVEAFKKKATIRSSADLDLVRNKKKTTSFNAAAFPAASTGGEQQDGTDHHQQHQQVTSVASLNALAKNHSSGLLISNSSFTRSKSHHAGTSGGSNAAWDLQSGSRAASASLRASAAIKGATNAAWDLNVTPTATTRRQGSGLSGMSMNSARSSTSTLGNLPGFGSPPGVGGIPGLSSPGMTSPLSGSAHQQQQQPPPPSNELDDILNSAIGDLNKDFLMPTFPKK